MTQAKHTPGPWRAGQYGAIYGVPEQVKIALVEQWIGAQESAESDANARLIAAAPMLLNALQNLLSDATAADLDNSEWSGSLIEARAAIKQATGE